MHHSAHGAGRTGRAERRRYELIVVLFASLVFLTAIVPPPSLMDDVDSVQAQIARNMLQSGDWVTCRLDGIAYLEKAPGPYWAMAACFAIFGVHDWSARIPFALAAVALCWLTARIGSWAFSLRAGFYAGLVLATSVGLFLFTRILIPDVILTLTITLALWSFARALEEEEPHPRRWAWLSAACLACGVLLKGLIAIVFPLGAALIYLLLTRSLFSLATWRRLHPYTGTLLFLAIAAPWHILATLRNPPYFDFTLSSGPGRYHGLVWFFPWSIYLYRLLRLNYRPVDRASKMRLLALCWIGFVMTFFTFSTTQEYYSMPIYPAVALLLGCVMAVGGSRIPARIGALIAAACCVTVTALLVASWGLPAPGDISAALTQNPDVYTLSLGHMTDLTLRAFAYLRVPLAVAALAFFIGAVAGWLRRDRAAITGLAAMMVLFFAAAHLALAVFDPYLSSKPLADALNRAPQGNLIVDDQYYAFSSIFFYTNYNALLLNGRVNNLEYGSNAPGAPNVFLTDADVPRLWQQGQRWYLVADRHELPRLNKLLTPARIHAIADAGGKMLLSNQ